MMTKKEAMAKAADLVREAAELAAQSRAKLKEAECLRAPHCTDLERQLLFASSEVACWPAEKVSEYRNSFGA